MAHYNDGVNPGWFARFLCRWFGHKVKTNQDHEYAIEYVAVMCFMYGKSMTEKDLPVKWCNRCWKTIEAAPTHSGECYGLPSHIWEDCGHCGEHCAHCGTPRVEAEAKKN
jgi:hypothetical protein